MMSPVTTCTNHCIASPEAALVTFITDKTTPKEFDEHCARSPLYKLNYSWLDLSALGQAASHGNILLIEHIVKVGGKELLHLGNQFGITPLFLAAKSNQTLAVRKLIELGADINMATNGEFRRDLVPLGATPLWTAVEKMVHERLSSVQHLMGKDKQIDMPLIKFLLKNKAVAQPVLSEAKSKILEKASKEIEAEQTQFKAVVAAAIPKMSLDLVNIITGLTDYDPDAPVS
jgi:hypothetical protein